MCNTMKKWHLIFLLSMMSPAVLCAQASSKNPDKLNGLKNIDKIVELKVGDKIYNFEAYDAAGKTHKLSSYTGKYILLDFSSVHCGPCVASADELRMLTKKYKNKLNVITFSADKKGEWLKGIKDEKVTWVSLNDGTGLRGKTMLKYRAPSFPGFYIISPQGVIVETWVGYEKLTTGTGYLEKHLIKYLKKA
ncbi:TlpA family protein disulfide reductase [Mucilaginibacter gilvus]|uniref:TlpA family protein disulfide reductase n=2 Tax=Mucilaginibacter gilvus TaxID=2305909 RepID=A0A3S3YZV5_9SPHI|nr:TlpA family protein disulfide reductase [Mucilaginibacter gilvus]